MTPAGIKNQFDDGDVPSLCLLCSSPETTGPIGDAIRGDAFSEALCGNCGVSVFKVDQTVRRVLEFFSALENESTRLELQTHVSQLGLDSLDMAEMIMALEEEFEFELSEFEIGELRTIGDFAKMILNIAGAG